MQPNSSPPSNPNPNPHHTMQAFHFLRLLSQINRQPLPAATRRSIYIRRAAYASMAYAVGPRRAWSRALLRRLRNGRVRIRSIGHRRVRRAGVSVVSSKPWGISSTTTTTIAATKADELRRLVPGGRSMDMFSLLEETGHYIQCLSSQVKVMQSIADSMHKNL